MDEATYSVKGTVRSKQRPVALSTRFNMYKAFIWLWEANCDAGKFKPWEKNVSLIKRLQLPHVLETLVIAKEKMHPQLKTSPALPWCGKKYAGWEPRRTIMCLGNAFSVDMMIHAWERKFVLCSVNTWFAMRRRPKETHYLMRDF